MFSIGFWELILIAIVILMFSKPEDIPKMARKCGDMVRYLQKIYYTIIHDLERK